MISDQEEEKRNEKEQIKRLVQEEEFFEEGAGSSLLVRLACLCDENGPANATQVTHDVRLDTAI